MYREVYVKSLSRHGLDSNECKKMFIECRTSASLNSLADTRDIKPVMLREHGKNDAAPYSRVPKNVTQVLFCPCPVLPV